MRHGVLYCARCVISANISARLPRDVDAAEIVARVGLRVAEGLRACDDGREGLTTLELGHHEAERARERAHDGRGRVARADRPLERRDHGQARADGRLVARAARLRGDEGDVKDQRAGERLLVGRGDAAVRLPFCTGAEHERLRVGAGHACRILVCSMG